jgi:homoserine dehydrogenase
MLDVEVLKFGSSVLRTARDLHLAVDEIYRRWRCGRRILAVVSAFEGVTDGLMAEVADELGADRSEAAAAYVATGEPIASCSYGSQLMAWPRYAFCSGISWRLCHSVACS